MAKLTKEQKILIYEKRKKGEAVSKIAKDFGVKANNINYLVSLIDKHGYSVLRGNKNQYYSPIIKQEIIDKVLVENQSIWSTAIQYGLLSGGMLTNWIKSYKDNDCVIVEKKRGRKSTMIKKNKKYKEMTTDEKLKYLESENLYLTAENEYLKKLKAVVQARKDQQQKKK